MNKLSVLAFMVYITACGGGGGNDNDAPPSTPTPAPAPMPDPAPTPDPAPAPPVSLACDDMTICDDFEASLNEQWQRDTGRGKAEISQQEANSGEQSLKLSTGGPFFTSSDIVPEPNIVVAFNFDDNSRDQSRLSQQVVAHNTSFTHGVRRGAVLLNGTDSYIEVMHSNALEISQDLTTSMWFQYQQQDTPEFYSLVEQSADEFGGHSRYGTWLVNNSQLTACIEPNTCPNNQTLCQRCITSPRLQFNEGQWYNVASTYDGLSLKLYRNGELVQSEDYNTQTGISTRPYPLTIGVDIYDDAPVFLKGAVDEVLVANIAINEDEVKKLFDRFASKRASLSIDLTNNDTLRQAMWGRVMVNLASSNASQNVNLGLLNATGTATDVVGLADGTEVSYAYGIAQNEQGQHVLRGTYNTFIDQDRDGQSDDVSDCVASGANSILPTDTWACLEWHFDSQNSQLSYWLNGSQVASVNMLGDVCAGSDASRVWLGPSQFDELTFGIIHKASQAATKVFIDDIKVGQSRVGCNLD